MPDSYIREEYIWKSDGLWNQCICFKNALLEIVVVGRIELKQRISWQQRLSNGVIGYGLHIENKSLENVDVHLLYIKCHTHTYTLKVSKPLSLTSSHLIFQQSRGGGRISLYLLFCRRAWMALSTRWLAKSHVAQMAELDLWFQKAVYITSGGKWSEAQMFSGRNETHAVMPKNKWK